MKDKILNGFIVFVIILFCIFIIASAIKCNKSEVTRNDLNPNQYETITVKTGQSFWGDSGVSGFVKKGTADKFLDNKLIGKIEVLNPQNGYKDQSIIIDSKQIITIKRGLYAW